MGLFSRFENKMEDTVEGAADKMAKAPISPVQIAKKAEKQMKREVMVGAGKEYAPTLYTVLVNPDDDERLFGYYPTLAGETETYLKAKAADEGLVMDGQPLVRFIVDDGLRHGKFDVIAEAVAAPIVAQLRQEEMARYGLAPAPQQARNVARQPQRPAPARPHQPQPAPYRTPAQPQQAAAQPYQQDQGFADPYAREAEEYAYDELGYGGNDKWDQGYEEVEEGPVQNEPKPPLPYVPEDEIDYSIDYGQYTFNSEDFENYNEKAKASAHRGAHSRPQPRQDHNQPIQVGRPPQGAGAASGVAAGAAAGAVAGAAGAAAGRVPAGHTVDFAGGQPVPNRHAVHARLINIAYQRTYDLGSSTITIGRDSSNDIVVQDINASRHHAELRLSPEGIWTIADLGSTNGTVVNGVAVAAQPLRSGDSIVIGKTEFQFALV